MSRKRINGKRIHLIVTFAQFRELQKLVKKTGLPMSEILRRAIDTYLLGKADG